MNKEEYERIRSEMKGKIDKLMKQYDEEEIDGQTYFDSMMNLSETYKGKFKDIQ